MATAVEITTQLCIKFEGLVLQPYLCSAGVPTIGIGSTRYADGRRVQLTDPPITQRQALDLFVITLQRDYLPEVLRMCPTLDTPERVAAIVDFAYNCGTSALRTSTLRKCILARDWAGAKVQLMRWTKANGRELRGLVLRRQAEAGLL